MKLLVSDYDGTFHTGRLDIDINVKMIRKFIKDGNIFALSSGRSYNSLKREVLVHDIPYNFLATCDGSMLFDKNGNNLMFNEINPNVIDDISDITNLGVKMEVNYTHLREYDKTHKKGDPLASISFKIDRSNITPEFQRLYDKLKDEHKDLDFFIYSWHDEFYYMIKPKNVTKSTPVKEISKRLQIPNKKIFTIGDNSNDFEMIRDYNGFMIGDCRELESVALKKYNAVYELVKDISKKRVLKR